MDLKEVLLMHGELYPRMQIQDMVKLVFQNEFGGGHLVRDEHASLHNLLAEWERIRLAGRKPPGYHFVDIGNGLCRLDLSVLNDTGVSPETVNRFFTNTAREIKGTLEGFERKLGVLKECCRSGLLGYSTGELEDYVAEYQRRGYPPVSHSDIYREEYSPAYRIIIDDYRAYFAVFVRIDSILKSKGRAVVAIDGNSGAGKSSLAELISGIYDCNVFHMDDFFLRPEQRTEERLGKTGEFVDHERFREEVIEGLKSGRPFSYRKFDCGRMALGETVQVLPKSLNIVEGSYSMHPSLAENYDLRIFMQINPEEQKRRILKRNGEAMLRRFVEEWIPRENRYFEEMKVRDKCDLVFGDA